MCNLISSLIQHSSPTLVAFSGPLSSTSSVFPTRSVSTPATKAAPATRHSSAKNWAAIPVRSVLGAWEPAVSVSGTAHQRASLESFSLPSVVSFAVSRTCHNSTYNKVVYFKNPSFPMTDSIQNFCDLTVNIVDPDICQLRIDFLEFQIDNPTEGNCLGDKFMVTASGMTPTSVPILCGNNRNQHRKSTRLAIEPNLSPPPPQCTFRCQSTRRSGRCRWCSRPTRSATIGSI